MRELEQMGFDGRESFRSWLEKNHDQSSGIWMVFFKKKLNVDCIEYQEALEEALCFGWIDSIIKKVDDDQYLRKFTPRTNVAKWSDQNKKLVLQLMEKNRMTEAGLKKIDVYVKSGRVDWVVERPACDAGGKELVVPDFILKELADNEPALTNFNRLAPTYKRHYVLWITSAKREETIKNRLNESIGLLKDNRKLEMK